jgi:MFS family permease
LLVLTFVVAWRAMHDIGFAPKPRVSVVGEMRGILRASLDHGLRNPPVRWLMLSAPITMGVSIYGFYAVQPYLLELYGNTDSYAIAGISASLVAVAQIVGGLSATAVSKAFRHGTSVLLLTAIVTAFMLLLIGLVTNFWLAMILLAVWAIMFSTAEPVRQALLNRLIPSAQRATVLSSDNLLASVGGAAIQPTLGKAADAWSYGTAYLISAGIQLVALPFVLRARQARVAPDEKVPSATFS